MILYVFTVLCLTGSAVAQVVVDGACPKAEMMQDFDLSKFVGLWYEIGRTEKPDWKGHLKCVTDNYTIDDNGDARVIWSYISRRTGRSVSCPGKIYPMDPADPATIKIRYSEDNYDRYLRVLGTDYESYVVLYGCANKSWTYKVWLYLWTKEQNPADTVLESAYEIIDKTGIPRLVLTKVKQSDCELKPDKPITA